MKIARVRVPRIPVNYKWWGPNEHVGIAVDDDYSTFILCDNLLDAMDLCEHFNVWIHTGRNKRQPKYNFDKILFKSGIK